MLKPGDLVDFFESRDSPPRAATVTGTLGAAWVSLKDENGVQHDQIRVVSTPYQSPFGGCCLPRSPQ